MENGHSYNLGMNVDVDRLSSLPDDLTHKILSLIGTKNAIQTSVLSSIWRFRRISLPVLDFSSEDFRYLPKFVQFVNNVLSCRNNQIDVSTIKLKFRGEAGHVVVQRIMDYAVSHNVQHMDVTCLVKKHFRLSVLSSQSLEHLTLRGSLYGGRTELTLKWELPYLTTLHLHGITLYVDNSDKSNGFFSKCKNLKNLTLSNCKMKGSDELSIFNPQLSNLVLDNLDMTTRIINVVAPQLKTLSITGSIGTYQISTPQLVSLLFKGHSPFLLATDGFHSLEKAHICNYSPFRTSAPEIHSLLQQLHNVKFLTINQDIVKILSLSVELHSHQTSAFSNLKSVWILPRIDKSYYGYKEDIMSAVIKNYFLKSSRNATLTLVRREECIDILPETSTAWLPSS